MTQVLNDSNADSDWSFWQSFPGMEKEEGEDEPSLQRGKEDDGMEGERQEDWQEEQKNKLKSIFNRRRQTLDPDQLDPDVIKNGFADLKQKTRENRRRSVSHNPIQQVDPIVAQGGFAHLKRPFENRRRSVSHGDKSDPGKEPPLALRRPKGRDSVSPLPPRRRRDRSPKEHGHVERSPPKEHVRDRSPKEPSLREKSPKRPPNGSSPRTRTLVRHAKPMDMATQVRPTAKSILDEDSSHGSEEFKAKEASPMAGSLNGSGPRVPQLRTSPKNSPISTREDRIHSRRQKMTKQNNSFSGGSLRRLLDSEDASPKPSLGLRKYATDKHSRPKAFIADDISIDDTVDLELKDKHTTATTRSGSGSSSLERDDNGGKSRRQNRTLSINHSAGASSERNVNVGRSRRLQRTLSIDTAELAYRGEHHKTAAKAKSRNSSHSPEEGIDHHGGKSRRGHRSTISPVEGGEQAAKSRRGQRTSVQAGNWEEPTASTEQQRGHRRASSDESMLEAARSRREHRTCAYNDTVTEEPTAIKSRSGQRPTVESRRSHLRRSLSDKLDHNSGEHQRSSSHAVESYSHKSKSSQHKSDKAPLTLGLEEQLEKVRQKTQHHEKNKVEVEEDEASVELIPPQATKKNKHVAEDGHNSRTKSGIEQSANISSNNQGHSFKGQSSLRGSLNAHASSDLKPKSRGKK